MSTAKLEVLRLFATLQARLAHSHTSLPLTITITASPPLPPPPQPPELEGRGGYVVVAAVLRTLTALPEAPPPRNSRHPHASTDGTWGATSPAETRREMASSASQILHAAPSHLLAPLAEELVEVALHAHEALHEEGRLLLQRLDEPPRQKAARKVVRLLLGAATEAAVASKAEPYAKLLEALYKGDPCMLHPHTEALVQLATGGFALGADVASATLPPLANDAAIFSKVVKQLQASGTEWQPTPVVRTLKLMGRLEPEEISRHEHATLFFRRCLLHPAPTVRRRPAPRKHAANSEQRCPPPPLPPYPPRVQVRLTFEVEILNKESWTGLLLAPHASLLLEAMQAQAMDPAPTEELRQGLRQGLVRALARLSDATLAPHVALLRGLMEREDAQKVQLEMIRLPAPILGQCSAVSWLADVLPK